MSVPFLFAAYISNSIVNAQRAGELFFFCLLFLKPLDPVRVLVVKIGVSNLRGINKRTSLQGLEKVPWGSRVSKARLSRELSTWPGSEGGRGEMVWMDLREMECIDRYGVSSLLIVIQPLLTSPTPGWEPLVA